MAWRRWLWPSRAVTGDCAPGGRLQVGGAVTPSGTHDAYIGVPGGAERPDQVRLGPAREVATGQVVSRQGMTRIGPLDQGDHEQPARPQHPRHLGQRGGKALARQVQVGNPGRRRRRGRHCRTAAAPGRPGRADNRGPRPGPASVRWRRRPRPAGRSAPGTGRCHSRGPRRARRLRVHGSEAPDRRQRPRAARPTRLPGAHRWRPFLIHRPHHLTGGLGRHPPPWYTSRTDGGSRRFRAAWSCRRA